MKTKKDGGVQSVRLITVGDIDVEIKYKRIKNMYLRLNKDTGKASVSAPVRTSEAAVVKFIDANYGWIKAKTAEIEKAKREKESELSADLAAEAGTLKIWGENAAVRRIYAGAEPEAKLYSDVVVIYADKDAEPQRLAAAVEKMQAAELESSVDALIRKYEPIIGAAPEAFRIKKMKSRWGSYSYNTKTMSVNFNLIKYPKECLEYVVVHELAHIFVPGHGKEFWKLVGRYYPNWRDSRDKLRK